ncbi:hypothetical protein DLREEDagr8_29630 [Dongia sp. agr-C8]
MLLVAAALGGGLPSVARASSVLLLPDATYYNSVLVTEPNGFQHFQSTDQATPGLTIAGGNPGYVPPQTWTVTTVNHYESPRLEAHVVVDSGTAGAAGSNLTYYVAFAGPDGTIPVTIRAAGRTNLGTFDSDYVGLRRENVVDATLIMNEYPSGDEVLSLNAESDLSNNQEAHLFSLDQQYMLKANTVYQVIMYATVYAAYGRLGDAFVDPTFTAPAGYSVLTSAGIGNGAVATTPIPGALPLFASGLGALGLFIGRRRKQAPTRPRLIAATKSLT